MCLVFITTTWSPQSPAKTSKRFDFRLLIRLEKWLNKVENTPGITIIAKKEDVVLDIRSLLERKQQTFSFTAIMWLLHATATSSSGWRMVPYHERDVYVNKEPQH